MSLTAPGAAAYEELAAALNELAAEMGENCGDDWGSRLLAECISPMQEAMYILTPENGMDAASIRETLDQTIDEISHVYNRDE